MRAAAERVIVGQTEMRYVGLAILAALGCATGQGSQVRAPAVASRPASPKSATVQGDGVDEDFQGPKPLSPREPTEDLTDLPRRCVMLPNRPLQQPNATPVRSDVRSCHDAAGCARGSSRP